MEKTYDIVVIGAGETGRGIAADLHQKGKKVAIVTLNDDAASLLERLIKTLAAGRPVPDPIPHGPDGVDTYRGNPLFKSAEKVLHVGDETLSAKYFVLAMGAVPRLPHIQGLEEVSFHTPLSLLKQAGCPPSCVIVGGGPIGTSLAGALVEKGTKPVLISTKPRLLPKEEPELGRFLTHALEKKGVRFELNASQLQTRALPGEKISFMFEREEERHEIDTDGLLLATGFESHSQGFGLETQGVYIDGEKRVVVNDQMRTSAPHIWAAGGVTGSPFHLALAEHQSHLLVNNMTSPFFSQMRMETEPFPFIIPTPPPLARLGLGEEEAKGKYKDCWTSLTPFPGANGACGEDKTEGLIKLIGRRRSGEIVGVHMLGPEAPSLILYFNLAKRAEIPLPDLTDRQHFPGPSPSDAVYRSIKTWVDTANT